LAHIAFNAGLNLVLGVPLEQFHGSLKMFVMYELGVFGGACCYFLADGHNKVVGTSGGCFALIGIRVGDLIMNWNQRPYRYWRLLFLSALVGMEVAVEAMSEPEGGVQTSNAAHVGGAAVGLFSGVVIGRNLEREACEWVLQAAFLLLGAAFLVWSLAVGMSWPPQNIFEETPWCWLRQVSNATLFDNWDWQCVKCFSAECIQEWSMQQRIYVVSEGGCDDSGYGFSEQ